ncbi:hypothetical protein [Aliarcobacter butzleri]|uniref:DUF4376 domain-containing protein n=1 Tax=Aliarcobacter butzleri L348 TaxID=1447256 RepID=A0A0G9K5R2_9BACT|nr:hypothetical protein [Aliarcobacter butzleri]KLE01882.1 hypothetical protein AA20_01855 [Aliarcobacter butzleri L348]
MIVYRYDTQTKEFIQELEINEAYGSNLPLTTTVKPLAKKEGFAVCFNGTKWEYIEDFRNTVVYLKEDKQESKVDYLGKIKDEHTLLIPNQFDKWNEVSKSWVEDDTLKKEYEKSLIPKTITLRQARLYLLSIGLLDNLENIISQNRAYQIEWEYANSIERESPLVKILGQTLNLNDTAIDNMFMEASKI